MGDVLGQAPDRSLQRAGLSELEALGRRLEQAVRVLGVSYDRRLWLAFEHAAH